LTQALDKKRQPPAQLLGGEAPDGATGLRGARL